MKGAIVALLVALLVLLGEAHLTYAGPAKMCAPTGWQADGARTSAEGAMVKTKRTARTTNDKGEGPTVAVLVPLEVIERARELAPRRPFLPFEVGEHELATAAQEGRLPEASGLALADHLRLAAGWVGALDGSPLRTFDDAAAVAECMPEVVEVRDEGERIVPKPHPKVMLERFRLYQDTIRAVLTAAERGDVATVAHALEVLEGRRGVEASRLAMARAIESTFPEELLAAKGRKPRLLVTYEGGREGQCAALRAALGRFDARYRGLTDDAIASAIGERKGGPDVWRVLARLMVEAGVEPGPASAARVRALADRLRNAKKMGPPKTHKR